MAQGRLTRFAVLLLAGCGGEVVPSSYLVYVRDAQGSVVAAVDDQGQKVWETHDDAYGLRLSSTGTSVPREFLDQPLDEETGFYQFEYRTYDPQSAQWLTPDPRLNADPGACAERPQQCNPYAYGGDRPLEWIDRDGRWAEPDVKIGSNHYQIITIAFVGKDAASGAALLTEAIERSNAEPGNRKILYDVRAFEDASQAPASYTKATWAADTDENKRSDYAPATSTIFLRSDARQLEHGLDVVNHEIQHCFGGEEKYDPKTMDSLKGYEHSIMANFYRQVGTPQITPQDLEDEANAKAAGWLNQSLTTPTLAGWPFPSPPPTQ